MKNKIKYILLLALVVLSSCDDDSKNPLDVTDESSSSSSSSSLEVQSSSSVSEVESSSSSLIQSSSSGYPEQIFNDSTSTLEVEQVEGENKIYIKGTTYKLNEISGIVDADGNYTGTVWQLYKVLFQTVVQVSSFDVDDTLHANYSFNWGDSPNQYIDLNFPSDKSNIITKNGVEVPFYYGNVESSFFPDSILLKIELDNDSLELIISPDVFERVNLNIFDSEKLDSLNLTLDDLKKGKYPFQNIYDIPSNYSSDLLELPQPDNHTRWVTKFTTSTGKNLYITYKASTHDRIYFAMPDSVPASEEHLQDCADQNLSFDQCAMYTGLLGNYSISGAY